VTAAPATLSWRTRVAVAVACLVWPPWLEVLPLPRLVVVPRADHPLPPTAWLVALGEAVDWRLRGAPWPWTRTCLRRALVLQRLLAARGHAVSLNVGVRRQHGALEAHAWIEHRGVPLLEAEPDRVPGYTVLGRFPERA
jgi:hypothetical protein